MKLDRQIVLAAVKQSWRALEYAANKMKEDRDIVKAAMSQNEDAVAYAACVLQSDADIVFTFVQLKMERWLSSKQVG